LNTKLKFIFSLFFSFFMFCFSVNAESHYQYPYSGMVITPQEDLYSQENFLQASPELTNLPMDYEVHVVSGYEPKDRISRITVNRPGKNVILV